MKDLVLESYFDCSKILFFGITFVFLSKSSVALGVYHKSFLYFFSWRKEIVFSVYHHVAGLYLVKCDEA